MRCLDDVDLGANTESTYKWNGNNIAYTTILYTCPPGRAFSGVGNRSVSGDCTFRTGADYSKVYWKYNGTNALPNCTRKYIS